jgi:hypothetical protein
LLVYCGKIVPPDDIPLVFFTSRNVFFAGTGLYREVSRVASRQYHRASISGWLLIPRLL